MSEFNAKQNKTVNSKYLDECIFAIARNDLSYMNELYELTHINVYSYVLSILKNSHDAEDVTHDCYVAIYNSAYQYKSKGKPLAWIITIAKNIAMSKLNERKRYDDKDISEYQIADTNKDLSVIDRSTLETVMNVLSDEERQVVILHGISGLKHREIASILDMSLSNVLSKYHRAIKKLKTQYEKGAQNE